MNNKVCTWIFLLLLFLFILLSHDSKGRNSLQFYCYITQKDRSFFDSQKCSHLFKWVPLSAFTSFIMTLLELNSSWLLFETLVWLTLITLIDSIFANLCRRVNQSILRVNMQFASKQMDCNWLNYVRRLKWIFCLLLLLSSRKWRKIMTWSVNGDKSHRNKRIRTWIAHSQAFYWVRRCVS